jgi:hypothetical protein
VDTKDVLGEPDNWIEIICVEPRLIHSDLGSVPIDYHHTSMRERGLWIVIQATDASLQELRR